MPVYNSAPYLAVAISSVLEERYHDFELLICDDASTDNSVCMAEDFQRHDNRICFFKNQQNSGKPGKVYQFLAEQADGDYIIASDSDDIACPNRLEILVGLAKANPHASLVYGKTRVVDSTNSKTLYHVGEPFDPYKLYVKNQVPDGCALIRKSSFDRVGGYDCDVLWAEDYELRLRLALDGDFVYVDEVVYVYREHRNSWSARHHDGEQKLGFKEEIHDICKRNLSRAGIDVLSSHEMIVSLCYCSAHIQLQEESRLRSASRVSAIGKFLWPVVARLQRGFFYKLLLIRIWDKTRQILTNIEKKVNRGIHGLRDGFLRRSHIQRALCEVGLSQQQSVLLYGDLTGLGLIAGGAHTVVDILKEIVGEKGQVVVGDVVGLTHTKPPRVDSQNEKDTEDSGFAASSGSILWPVEKILRTDGFILLLGGSLENISPFNCYEIHKLEALLTTNLVENKKTTIRGMEFCLFSARQFVSVLGRIVSGRPDVFVKHVSESERRHEALQGLFENSGVLQVSPKEKV